MLVNDVIASIIKGVWGNEPLDNEENVSVIKTNNMTYEGHLNLSDTTYRYFDTDVSNSYLRKGDLLVEKSGGTKTHSVGYINIFEGKEKTYVANNFILVLRPNQNLIRPKYLFYQLKHKYESGEIRNCYNQTTGIQNLKVATYLNKHIVCADFETQDAQLNVLDSISNEISKQNQLIFNYNALIKSQFNEMFGDINDKNNGYTINDICVSIVRGPFGSSLKKEYLVKKAIGTYKVYEQKHAIRKNAFVGDYYINQTKFNELKRFRVQSGDFIMSCSGTIGELFKLPPDCEDGIINQALLKFAVNHTLVNDCYFLYAMKIIIESIDRYGAAIQNITSVSVIKKKLV